MGPKSNMVIVQTILQYNLERRREFNTLKEQLKTCCCFPTRRKIKLRLEELNEILSRDYMLPKYDLVQTLGIKYKELKKYPELIEITRKKKELQRLIA
jgi:16S rRNA C1402 (ribose-2'-O) methylase RsmI